MLAAPRRPDELPASCRMFWRAFHALRFDRALGFGGEGPIYYSAIDAYARRNAIEGAAFAMLHGLIVAMDDEYLAWAGEKIPRGDQDQNRTDQP